MYRFSFVRQKYLKNRRESFYFEIKKKSISTESYIKRYPDRGCGEGINLDSTCDAQQYTFVGN